MNTKTILSLLLVSSLALTSCKKELEPQESSPNTEAVTPITETATNTVAPATPPQMQQNTTVVNPNTVTPTTTSTAKGMNPAHGQPGHRCDISVGAPLNSPPGKTSPPPPTTQIKQSENSAMKVTPAVMNPNGSLSAGSNTPTSGTPALLTTTAPGMNPPHGQEGHVCGTAVGAPLPK